MVFDPCSFKNMSKTASRDLSHRLLDHPPAKNSHLLVCTIFHLQRFAGNRHHRFLYWPCSLHVKLHSRFAPVLCALSFPCLCCCALFCDSLSSIPHSRLFLRTMYSFPSRLQARQTGYGKRPLPRSAAAVALARGPFASPSQTSQRCSRLSWPG